MTADPSSTPLGRALALLRPEADARSLADALWLAHALAQSRPAEVGRAEREPIRQREEELQNPPLEPPLPPTDTGANNQPDARLNQPEGRTSLFPAAPTKMSDDSLAASVVRVPASEALPNRRRLELALRPYLRRRLSSWQTELDVLRTVHACAERRQITPILRRRRERWFAVQLFVEHTDSMMVWSDTAQALRQMLERHGAFRRVQLTPYVASDDLTPDRASVVPGGGVGVREVAHRLRRPPASAAEHTLVLFLTDGMGRHWSHPPFLALLTAMTRRSVVAILQLLPSSHWPHTRLGGANYYVRSRESGAPTRDLCAYEPQEHRMSRRRGRCYVPMLSLEPTQVARWSRFVVSSQRLFHEAIRIGSYNQWFSEEDDGPKGAAALIRAFRRIASPGAFTLLRRIAFMPKTALAAIRLLQRVGPPPREIVHLSEVLDSGLLRRVDDADAACGDEVLFEFLPNVREALLSSMSRQEKLQSDRDRAHVLASLRSYIEARAGRTISEFTALRPDPAGTQRLPASLQPFVTVGALIENVGRAHASNPPPTTLIDADELTTADAQQRMLIRAEQAVCTQPPHAVAPAIRDIIALYLSVVADPAQSSAADRCRSIVSTFLDRLGFPSPRRDAIARAEQWLRGGEPLEQQAVPWAVAILGSDRIGRHARFAHDLVRQLAARGLTVRVTDGDNAGALLVGGHHPLHDEGVTRPTLSSTPTPAAQHAPLRRAAVALVFGGSERTMREVWLAQSHGIPVLPLHFTGGAARELWSIERPRLQPSNQSEDWTSVLQQALPDMEGADRVARITASLVRTITRDQPAHPPVDVLVAGSRSTQPSPTEQLAAQTLGAALARHGCRLITGGFTGVDELVATSFSAQLTTYEQRDRLTRVAAEPRAPVVPWGRLVKVASTEEELELPVAMAQAVVVLGNAGETRRVAEVAREAGKPVYAFPRTGVDMLLASSLVRDDAQRSGEELAAELTAQIVARHAVVDVTLTSYTTTPEEGPCRARDLVQTAPRHRCEGHTHHVDCVAWSADGRMLASGSYDNTIRLWDPDLSQARSVLSGHTLGVSSLAFSPSGRELVSASYDHTLRIWEPRQQTPCRVDGQHRASVRAVAWTARDVIASGDEEGRVILRDGRHGRILREAHRPNAWVLDIAASADGRHIAFVQGDGTVALLHDEDRGVPRVLGAHPTYVNAVAWSPTGFLCSGAGDGSIYIWDVRWNGPVRKLNAHEQKILRLSFSHDGQYLAALGQDALTLWNARSWKRVYRIEGPYPTQTYRPLGFRPETLMLAMPAREAMNAFEIAEVIDRRGSSDTSAAVF